MRCAIYTRVSTLEQATEGYSISVQKEKLSSYANALGYEISNIYSDEGFSGKSLSRPAIETLLKDIKQKKIDIVLIYKLDRLSRRVIDVLNLVETFDKYNVTLYSLNENIDLSSPFGRAALKMSATFSELERETIVERMMMGKNARAKSGKFSSSVVPFGYTKDGDYFKADIEQSEIINKLFDLYISGDYTFRSLYRYAKEHYPEQSYFNNEMCCKRLIHRIMYSGYFEHNGEVVKGTNFDTIITYETYLKAQARVKANTTKRRLDHTPYLLTGLLVCSKCGYNFCGKLYDRQNTKKDGSKSKRYKNRKYGCEKRIKSSIDKKFKCDNLIYDTEPLDNYILDIVSKIRFNDSQLNNYIPGLIDKLISDNANLEERKNKLLDLYLDNTIDKETYQLRIVEIETKLNENKMLIKSESDKVAHSPSDSKDKLNNKLENLKVLPKKEQITILNAIIKNIAINDNNIIISYRF